MRKIILNESQLLLILEDSIGIDNIYEKYYAKIPRDKFDEICGLDPTFNGNKLGNYCKWLLSLYLRKKLKDEDFYKARDYLKAFNDYKAKIQVRDINQYKDLPSLYSAVKEFMQDPSIPHSKSEEIRKIKEGAEAVYEDKEWLVIVPHTEEASIYYGKGTQWCTAAEHSENMFDEYNDQGPLYININKKSKRKYQFHFETSSFMDENDRELDICYDENAMGLAAEIGMSEGLVMFYRDLGHYVGYLDDDRRAAIDYSFPYGLQDYGTDSIDSYGKDVEDIIDDWNRELASEYDNDKVIVEVFAQNMVLAKAFDKYTLYSFYNENLLSGRWYNYISAPACGWFAIEDSVGANFVSLQTGKKMFSTMYEIDKASQFNREIGTAIVIKDKKMQVVDTEGHWVLDKWYNHVSVCKSRDKKYVWFKTNDETGYNMVDLQGKKLLPFNVKDLGDFWNTSNGEAYFMTFDKKSGRVSPQGEIRQGLV